MYLGDPGRPYVPKEGLVEVASFDVPDTGGLPTDPPRSAGRRSGGFPEGEREMHHVGNSGLPIVTT